MRKAIAISCIAAMMGCVQINPKLLDWVEKQYGSRQPIAAYKGRHEYPDGSLPIQSSGSGYKADFHAVQVRRVTVMPIPRDYPICLDSVNAQIAEKTLVLDKSRYKLSVYENVSDRNWFLEKDYLVSLGRNPGPKTRNGDMKTPEGRYRITRKMSIEGAYRSDYLASLNRMRIGGSQGAFGDYALMLDYPSSSDRAKSYTGSGIMLHSVRDGRVGEARTNGCIGLLSTDMKDLFERSHEGMIVLIVPDAND